MGGTADRFLYEHQRRDWREYRISAIPNGDYIVTLGFAEIAVLEDFGPAYTLFDVSIEGETVLDDFNIFEQVGGNYATRCSFPAQVLDGELNIAAESVFGESSLATLEVFRHPVDHTPPDRPANLSGLGSYGAGLLSWDDSPEEDLDGYLVYRASSADGPYERLTGQPVYKARYQDVVTSTLSPYYYAVSAIDVFGNESTSARSGPLTAVDNSAAKLPYLELELPQESQQLLHDDPWSNDEVPASLTYRSQTFPVEVRYRGNWGRYHNKKSWKIRFPFGSPFPGQSEINLRADFMDLTLMRSLLATSLFEAAGIRPREAQHVLLAVNGQYRGVYTMAEQIDEDFLVRTGRDPGTSIYKPIATDEMDFSRALSSESAYHSAFEKKTNRDLSYGDLASLIDLINTTPDEAFPYELAQVFDVASYLDSYAVIVLTSSPDFTAHNAYLLHDLTANRWELTPYDFDRAFHPEGSWLEIRADSPIDAGTSGSPVWGWVTSTLLSRVLDVPQFRDYYCHRLSEFLDTAFSEEAMEGLINDTYAAIADDARRDWYKLGWEDNEWFDDAPRRLNAYVRERRHFLSDSLPSYCSTGQGPFLRINEISLGPTGDVPAEDAGSGGIPGWIELHNSGLEPVELSRLYVTDDLSAPRKFRIDGDATIAASSVILISADRQPSLGSLHANFLLSPTGGEVALTDGRTTIDSHSYDKLASRESEGRVPDGGPAWRTLHIPTPGKPNSLRPPRISSVVRTPLLPTAGEMFTVTATITDDGDLLTTALFFAYGAQGFQTVPLQRTRSDDFTAQLLAPPKGETASYYLLAVDDDKQVTTAPAEGEASPFEFVAGYRTPVLFISEFMADNHSVSLDPADFSVFPDWVEIHNPGSEPVQLAGRYLSDDLTNPTKFLITGEVSVPAQGFIVFYADGKPELGPLHTNFRLNRRGESIGLFDVDSAGNLPIDQHVFGWQVADLPQKRYPPDGSTWIKSRTPTPGSGDVSPLLLPTVLQQD